MPPQIADCTAVADIDLIDLTVGMSFFE